MLMLLLALAGCSSDGRPADSQVPQMQSATITGSAETPDPILERVRALEREGRVTDVMVMESFPVQIRLRASKDVIEELQAMPRKGGLH